MQNGCFCCTLQNDLVDQIKELAIKKTFDYMLIEASGVSEPSQIAPLFEPCEDEHDHEEEHSEGPQLSEVARLDTCITVVDAAEFYNNLDSMKVSLKKFDHSSLPNRSVGCNKCKLGSDTDMYFLNADGS